MSITAVTDSTFATEVLSCSEPVVVDYWADYCAPCRQLTPVLEELATQYAGQVKFVSLDACSNTKTTTQHDIRTLPTIHIFEKGEITNAIVGSVTKMKLRQAVEAVL